jgi:hypothetical protein
MPLASIQIPQGDFNGLTKIIGAKGGPLLARTFFFTGMTILGLAFLFLVIYRSLSSILGPQPTGLLLGIVSLGVGIWGIRRTLTIFKQ